MPREFPVNVVVATYEPSEVHTSPMIRDVCALLSYMTGENITPETMLDASARVHACLDMQFPQKGVMLGMPSAHINGPSLHFAANQIKGGPGKLARFYIAPGREDLLEARLYDHADYFKAETLPVYGLHEQEEFAASRIVASGITAAAPAPKHP